MVDVILFGDFSPQFRYSGITFLEMTTWLLRFSTLLAWDTSFETTNNSLLFPPVFN